LKAMGFNWIRCLVTRSILKAGRRKAKANPVSAAMKAAGFRRDYTRFASFFREV
jgi:hypothetical protein